MGSAHLMEDAENLHSHRHPGLILILYNQLWGTRKLGRGESEVVEWWEIVTSHSKANYFKNEVYGL